MAHKGKKTKPTPEELPLVHPHAAGIDVGAEEHWVCVPADRDVEPIQKFSAFTCDLYPIFRKRVFKILLLNQSLRRKFVVSRLPTS
jgi:hypothetical protein